MKHEDALTANFEYCNELAERINFMADAITILSRKVTEIESYFDPMNDELKPKVYKFPGCIHGIVGNCSVCDTHEERTRNFVDNLANKLMEK